MKNKLKIFLSLTLVFFFVGCTPKLTYTISGNNISESIEINFGNDSDRKTIEQTLDYYSHRKDLNGYKGIISLDETPMNTYFANNTVLINQCYEDVDFSYKAFEGKYSIKTSKGFQCLVYDYNVVDELFVSIKSYNKVYEHNADEVKNNVYTWHITRDNMDDQSILFVVGNKKYAWYYQYRFLIVGLGLVLGLALIVKIVIIIFKNISKNVNHI